MRSPGRSRNGLRAIAFHGCGLSGAAAYAWLCVASRGTSGARLGELFAALAAAWVVVAVAHRVVSRGLGPRAVLLGVLTWGVVFRLIGILAQPVLEDDFYRYLWDGRNFALHGTPYDRPPLADFGDDDVPVEFQAVLDGINNPDLPTIYSPVWEYAFLLGYRVAPASLVPLKVLLLGAELATLFLLFGWRRPGGALLYFWCPLLVQESAFNGHPESLGILFLAVALWALEGGRRAWVSVATGLALGSRVFAGLMVPFLLLRQRWHGWLVFAGTLAVLYAPFLAAGDGLQSMSLQAFARDWEFNSSAFALSSLALGPDTARWVSAVVFGAFYSTIFLRHLRGNSERRLPRADRLFGVFFLLAPVVNPWYLLWLLPFACRDPSRWAFTALAAVSVSYVHGLALPSLGLAGYAHPWWLRPIEFGVILIAALTDWRRPLHPADARLSVS